LIQTTSVNTKLDAGAPGPTGTSPGQDVGSDDNQVQLNTHQEPKQAHSASSKKSGTSSSSKDEKGMKSDSMNLLDTSGTTASTNTNKESLTSAETDPGVTASTKTESGAPGPTGTAPGEGIGSDETRDESPKHHDHHKHHDNQKAESNHCKTLSKTGSSSKSPHNSTSGTSTSNKSEDGFDGPNASFTSEIGSKNDPGRVAEKNMYEKNAQTGDVGSMGVKQGSITGGGQFDALNQEESA